MSIEGTTGNWQVAYDYLVDPNQRKWLGSSTDMKDKTNTDTKGGLTSEEVSNFFSARNLLDSKGNVSKVAVSIWLEGNNQNGRLDALSGTQGTEAGIDFWYNAFTGLQDHLDSSGDIDNYRQMDNWEAMHNKNMEHLDNEEIDENKYIETSAEIGYNFNFMQGLDPNDEEAYDKQTLNLGKGEVAAKDSDENGSVDFGEYFSEETAAEIVKYKEMIKNGEIDKETAINTFADIFLQSKAVFQIIDEAMGDGSGELDETEFQKYYQHLDEFVDGSGKTNKDGQFNLDTYTEYPAFLVSANQIKFSDEDRAVAAEFVSKLFD